MHRFKLTFALASLLGLSSLSTGCAVDDPADQLTVSCEGGKCDGFDSIRALIADAKKLDLGDLVALSAGYATDGLNDALDVSDYAGIELRATEFYGLQEDVEQDLTLHSLNKLVSGLASRFGERELSTEVNRIRAEHLQDPAFDDRYFAESAFRIDASLGHNWGFKSKGFGDDEDLSINIGFKLDGDLEARIISAYDDELSGVARAPLAAIKAARGFIFPRSVKDVREMRPGESYALKGDGNMGINVGAGVPILIAEPASFLTYNIVLTAGLRSQLEGQMDIQLLRMQGDEVVVDVGMEVSSVKSARIGLRDGWGVSGLVEQDVEIAGIDVDLGNLVEKALQKELNRKLRLVSAEASKSNKSTRMSVARMRFSLDRADAEGQLEEALAQALKGDVRLAQALANRGDTGVVAEFDLIRSGVASASHAGIEIFGMHFFRTTQESEGQAVIQTPGGATALMFESLHKEGGWFFASHGYGRTGLAGLMYDAEGGAPAGETNLFISVQEGDEFMERDKLIDHLDGMILAIAGSEALGELEAITNRMEQMVLELCPVPKAGDDEFFSEQCNKDLISNNAEFAALRDSAYAAIESRVGHLPKEHADMVLEAANLKIVSQSIEDANAALVGPKTSIVLDYRLDNGTLEELFAGNDGEDFKSSVLRFLQVTQADRTEANIAAQRETIETRLDDDVEPMVEAFDEYANQYLRLASLEDANIESLGNIGSNAIEIRFTVDKDKRPEYEKATSRSIAQARSQVAMDFFDEMMELADDIGRAGTGRAPHEEQTVAYGLLGLTNPERLDLRVDIDVDTSSCFLCGDLDRYDLAGFEGYDLRAKGEAVKPIGGGLFDINSIIDLQ